MFKWREFYGLSAGLKLVMSNHEGRFPLLKNISLPSSFWSLPPHQFSGFMRYINSDHITNISFLIRSNCSRDHRNREGGVE